ncbi:(Fe-S)-binding protein [Bacillus gobiensis]
MNTQEKIQTDFKKRMDEKELLNCMRCGFCLPSCPTYIETNKNEAASPRGRIALMKGVVDGHIEPDKDVEHQLNLCLGCRACEPVCPAGVKYGQLLEEARDIIEQNKKHSLPVKVLRKAVFHHFFPYPNRIRGVMVLMSFYQRSGLQKVVRKSGVLKLLGENLSDMEKILPKVPGIRKMKGRPHHVKPEGKIKKRVAFFSGCLMGTMFLPTNDATIKLLQLSGCEVVIPKEQCCCGALHGHSGEKEKAKELAKRNIIAFEDLKVDAIITNAGGCGAFLIEYDHLLRDDPRWADRAAAFSSKLKDLSAVLTELDFHKQKLSLQNETITYQDSCHLRNVMGTSSEPRKLLQAIQGSEYREMKNADRCCGSAGIYNLVEQEMSMQILDHKMENAEASEATIIVTANPGCLLQMKLGIQREGLENKVRAVHIADLLVEAIADDKNQKPL